MRRFSVIPVVLGVALLPAAVSAIGCPSAKPPPVVAEKPKLGPIETPENILAQVMVRDPQLAFERLATGAGAPTPLAARVFKSTVGDSLPPGLRLVLDEIDLHGNFGMVMLGEPKDFGTGHYAVALKLKSGASTTKALAEHTKQGKLKSAQDDAIGTMAYVEGAAFNMAVLGEVLVAADDKATLDLAGRWIARETIDGTPAHDFSVHIPFSRFGKGLSAEAKKGWGDQASGDKAGLDPLMQTLTDTIAAIGDADITFDVDKENAAFEAHVTAMGTLSEWASTFPAGSPASVLTLPKAPHALVMRFPDSVSALFKAPPPEAPAPAASGSASGSASAVAKAAPPPKAPPPAPPAEGKDALKNLGKALGHEVAIAWAGKDDKKDKDSASSAVLPFKSFMIRFELEDAAGARAALKDFFSLGFKGGSTKISRTGFSKWGGDGETITLTETTGSYAARWAVKGSYLYLEVGLDSKAMLSDLALDPSGKGTFKDDPRAKAASEKFPKDGLALAYVGEVSAAEAAPAKKEPAKKDEKKEEKKADKKDDKKADDKKADKKDEKSDDKKTEEKPIVGFRWGWVTAQKGHIAAQFNLPDIGFRDNVVPLFDTAIKEEKDKAEEAKKKSEEDAAAKKKAEEDKAKKDAEDQEKANAELAKKEADKLKKEEEAKAEAEKKAKAKAEKAEKKKKKKKKAEDE